jgi:hypothetical protein
MCSQNRWCAEGEMLVPINSGSFLLTHTSTAYNTGNRIKHDMNLLTKNCIGRSSYTSSICLYSEIPCLEVKHAKNKATININICIYICIYIYVYLYIYTYVQLFSIIFHVHFDIFSLIPKWLVRRPPAGPKAKRSGSRPLWRRGGWVKNDGKT